MYAKSLFEELNDWNSFFYSSLNYQTNFFGLRKTCLDLNDSSLKSLFSYLGKTSDFSVYMHMVDLPVNWIANWRVGYGIANQLTAYKLIN